MPVICNTLQKDLSRAAQGVCREVGGLEQAIQSARLALGTVELDRMEDAYLEQFRKGWDRVAERIVDLYCGEKQKGVSSGR